MYHSCLVHSKSIIPQTFLLASILLGVSFSLVSLSSEIWHKQSSTAMRTCLTFLFGKVLLPRQLKLEWNSCPRKKKVRETFYHLGSFRNQDKEEEGEPWHLLQNCTWLNFDLIPLWHIINFQCIPHTWKQNTSHCRVSLKLCPPFVSFACSISPINFVSPGQVS